MKKLLSLTTSAIFLIIISMAICIKVNMKKKGSTDYKENFAKFAESLYNHHHHHTGKILHHSGQGYSPVSEEKIDQESGSLDLNFGNLINGQFLETKSKGKFLITQP